MDRGDWGYSLAPRKKRDRKLLNDTAQLQLAAERGRAWLDTRKPSLPRVKFLERTPPELYDGFDWRDRVNEWRIANKILPLLPSA